MTTPQIACDIALEGNSEFFVFWVWRDFLNESSPYIAGERILYLADTSIDIVGCSLCEHFHRSIRQVADEAGQPIAAGHMVCGEAKAHPLNMATENYMFGNLAHF